MDSSDTCAWRGARDIDVVVRGGRSATLRTHPRSKKRGAAARASNEPLIDIHSRENNYGLDRTG